MDRVAKYLIDNGKFTENEFQEHEKAIKGTFIYQKTALEFALKDMGREILNAFKLK